MRLADKIAMIDMKKGLNTSKKKRDKSKSRIVILIGILLIASFFIGYSIKKYSASSEIQMLQEQITNLQDQNRWLQQQIDKLQTVPGFEKPEAKNIPSSVLAKYNELEPQYKDEFGTSISYCTKG